MKGYRSGSKRTLDVLLMAAQATVRDSRRNESFRKFHLSAGDAGDAFR